MLQTPVEPLDPEWYCIRQCLKLKKWVLAILHLVVSLAEGALLAHPPELLVSDQHGEQADKHHQVPAPQALHCSGWTNSKCGKF